MIIFEEDRENSDMRLLTVFLLTISSFFLNAQQFIENTGQWPDHVLFCAELADMTCYIETGGITTVVTHPEDRRKWALQQHNDAEEDATFAPRAHALKFNWLKTSENTKVSSVNWSSEAIYRYYGCFGEQKEPSRAASAFTLTNVWPGIDIRFGFNGGKLKYDYLVSAEADKNDIAIEIEGADALNLRNNALHIGTSCGTLIEHLPECWAVNEGEKTTVDIDYTVEGRRVGLRWLADHESAYIIDPELVFATYIGATLQPDGIPATNNSIGCGSNSSPNGDMVVTSMFGNDVNYPQTIGTILLLPGNGGVGVTRFSSDGNELTWSTRINLGARPLAMYFESDYLALVIASNECSSQSLFFTEPQLCASDPDPVYEYLSMLVFTADGSELIAARCIGSYDHHNSGGPKRPLAGIDRTPEGDYVVVASSPDSNFPSTPGVAQENWAGTRDAVLFKISDDLETLHWSTYYGGESNDYGSSVKVAEDGSIYICGHTTSNDFIFDGTLSPDDFPGLLSLQAGFLAHFTAEGELLNARVFDYLPDFDLDYLGVGLKEALFFVDTDPQGNVVVIGTNENNTADIPVTEGLYLNPDGGCFIAACTPDLNEVIYTTRIGYEPTRNHMPVAFMVDDCGYIYTSICTRSGGLITDAPLTDDALADQGGFYLAVYEPGMTGLEYATLAGGDHIDAGYSVFDERGVVYQTVCVPPEETYFTTTPGAWAEEKSLLYELGAFKIDMERNISVAQFGLSRIDTTECPPYHIAFNNFSTEGEVGFFINGEPTELADTLVFDSGGTYEIGLSVFNPETCNQTDTLYKVLNLPEYSPPVSLADIATSDLCTPGGFQVDGVFTGDTNGEVLWQLNDDPVASGDVLNTTLNLAGSYELQVIATDSLCFANDTLSASFDYTPFDVSFETTVSDSCTLPVTFNATVQGNGWSATQWLTDGSIQSDQVTFSTAFSDPGTYTITAEVSSEACGTVSQSWEVEALGTVVVATELEDDITLCEGDAIELNASTSQGTIEWVNSEGASFDNGQAFTASNEQDTLLAVATDLQSCNLADTLEITIQTVTPPNAGMTISWLSDICDPEALLQLSYTGQNAQEVEWSDGQGNTPVGESTLATYTESGTYTIEQWAVNPPCQPAYTSEEVFVEVFEPGSNELSVVPNIITPNNDAVNDCFRLPSNDAEQSLRSNISLEIYNRWGVLIAAVEGDNPQWCPTPDISAGQYIAVLKFLDICSGEQQVIRQYLTVKKDYRR